MVVLLACTATCVRPLNEESAVGTIIVDVHPGLAPGTVVDLSSVGDPITGGFGPFDVVNELHLLGRARYPVVESGSITIDKPILRGDSNEDTEVDLSDAIWTLLWLFFGSAPLPCEDAADVDDRGVLDVNDGIVLLAHLFLSLDLFPGIPPGAGLCDIDRTEDSLLECLSAPSDG